MIFPGFFEREKAGYDSGSGRYSARPAYPIFSQGIGYEPFAGLAYVHIGSGSFNEDGGIDSR